MTTHILWDETKRQVNLDKHGLDFIDAVMVLESPYRMTLRVCAAENSERSRSPTCLMCWQF